MTSNAPIKTPSHLWGVGIVLIGMLLAVGVFGYGLWRNNTAPPRVVLPIDIHNTSEALLLESAHNQWKVTLNGKTLPIKSTATSTGYLLDVDLTQISGPIYQDLKLQSIKTPKRILTIPIKRPVRQTYEDATVVVRLPARAFEPLQKRLAATTQLKLEDVITGSLCGVKLTQTSWSMKLVDDAVRVAVHVEGTQKFSGDMSVDLALSVKNDSLHIQPKANTIKTKFSTPNFVADDTIKCQTMAQLNGVINWVLSFSRQQLESLTKNAVQEVLMPPINSTISTATDTIAVDWVNIKAGALFLGARPRIATKKERPWQALMDRQIKRTQQVSDDASNKLMLNVHVQALNFALNKTISTSKQNQTIAGAIEQATKNQQTAWRLEQCTVLASPNIKHTKNAIYAKIPAIKCTLVTKNDDKYAHQTFIFGAQVPLRATGSKVMFDWQNMFAWWRCHDNTNMVTQCGRPFGEKETFKAGMVRAMPAVLPLGILYPMLQNHHIQSLRLWNDPDTTSGRMDIELTTEDWARHYKQIPGWQK